MRAPMPDAGDPVSSEPARLPCASSTVRADAVENDGSDPSQAPEFGLSGRKLRQRAARDDGSTIFFFDDLSLRRAAMSDFLANNLESVVIPIGDLREIVARHQRQLDQAMLLISAGAADLSAESPASRLLHESQRRWPDLPVALLSDVPTPDQVAYAVERGVNGFIPTASRADVVLATIRLIQAGGTFFPTETFVRAQRRTAGNGMLADPPAELYPPNNPDAGYPSRAGGEAPCQRRSGGERRAAAPGPAAANPHGLEAPERSSAAPDEAAHRENAGGDRRTAEPQPGAAQPSPPRSFDPTPSAPQQPAPEARRDADRPPADAQQPPLLTGRQREVLLLLKEGHPNKVIAYRLNMRESTVKVHVRNIMRRLGVTNRTQAAYRADAVLAQCPPATGLDDDEEA